MSQHDLIINNSSGATVRADITAALQALGSTSKGNSPPGTIYAGQLWVDDNTPSSSVWTLNVYDGSDSIKLGDCCRAFQQCSAEGNRRACLRRMSTHKCSGGSGVHAQWTLASFQHRLALIARNAHRAACAILA